MTHSTVRDSSIDSPLKSVPLAAAPGRGAAFLDRRARRAGVDARADANERERTIETPRDRDDRARAGERARGDDGNGRRVTMAPPPASAVDDARLGPLLAPVEEYLRACGLNKTVQAMRSERKLKAHRTLVEASEAAGADASEGGAEALVEAWEESRGAKRKAN